MGKAYEYCGISFYIINEENERHHRKHVKVVAPNGKVANYYIDVLGGERDENCRPLEPKIEKKVKRILSSAVHRAAFEAYWDNEQKDNPIIPRPLVPKARHAEFG